MKDDLKRVMTSRTLAEETESRLDPKSTLLLLPERFL